jgi:hypothetical protein
MMQHALHHNTCSTPTGVVTPAGPQRHLIHFVSASLALAIIALLVGPALLEAAATRALVVSEVEAEGLAA